MRAGSFAVPSGSHPGVNRVVIWITEGTAHCFCEGFQHRGTCRHVAETALAVEIEARQSLERATRATRAEAASALAAIAQEFDR